MKRILFIAAIAATMMACSSPAEKNEETTTKTATAEVIATDLQGILNAPANFVDKQVKLQGLVTHVCSHGGKRMFIQNQNGDLKLKATVGENIAAFSKDMEGTQVEVIGIFKEERIDLNKIDEMEKELREGIDVEATHDHGENHDDAEQHESEEDELQSKIDKLNAMREQIKASEEGYISDLWIVCSDVEKIAE